MYTSSASGKRSTLARHAALYREAWGWDSKRKKRLLLDLVSLQGDQTSPFWKQWGNFFAKEYRQSLLKWRDELRQLWKGDDALAGDILLGWMHAGPSTFDALAEDRWVVHPVVGGLFPNPKLLPLMLALSVGELRPKLACCENPNCPQQYFIRAKPKQRFCDISACAKIGQRKHKRAWWAKHVAEQKKKYGKKWRSNESKKSPGDRRR